MEGSPLATALIHAHETRPSDAPPWEGREEGDSEVEKGIIVSRDSFFFEMKKSITHEVKSKYIIIQR